MTETYHRDLNLGSKTLAVDVNGNNQTASVRFGTREKFRFLRKPGETTQLYLLAEALIYEWVTRHNRPLTLRFDTANAALKGWARQNQTGLGFEVEPENPDAWRITVTKRFSPKE